MRILKFVEFYVCVYIDCYLRLYKVSCLNECFYGKKISFV